MVVDEKRVKLPVCNFPAVWQAVIYRNYGFVKTERIAKVLGCAEQVVEKEAKRLGLGAVEYDPEWERSGYLTIIRNNWYLLPAKQIETLLDYSESRLDYILKEEDFLFVKLGNIKPVCNEVKYKPLTGEEAAETERAAKILNRAGEEEGRAFRFFENDTEEPENGGPYTDAPGTRIVHGYLSPCGDVFMSDPEEYLPDALLERYRRSGVNGLWIHALLSGLSPYPFYPALSEGYIKRRENLNKLIKRCAAFGIKVYLYMNEPRCLPVDKFVKYAYLMGHRHMNTASLCFSYPEVKEYLYDAVKDLAENAAGLGGIITITMSENLTHCRCFKECNCPRCKDVPKWQMAAEVNNIMMRAVKAAGTGCRIIANLWGWADYMGFTEEDVRRGIDALDKDIAVLCVSELSKEVERMGVKSIINEYSISAVGPSEQSAKNLAYAKKTGHTVFAKIQINSSWELSSVPMLPLFDLVYSHLENLKKVGVGDYMMSWTLGGYPSEALGLAAAFADEVSLSEWYKDSYGADAERVHAAVKEFCAAFENYPVSMEVLYFSPVNLGYGNMWEPEPSENESAMVSWSFDDVEKWTDPYPPATFVALYKKMTEGWKNGLELLGGVNGERENRLLLYAEAAYLQLKACLNHTLFALYKRDIPANRQRIKEVLKDSEKDVLRLIEVQRKDPAIGYEASNHYFFNIRLLKEKLLNLDMIGRQIDAMK